MKNGEMKVADVINWVLNNMYNNGKPSKNDIWFASMLEEKYSTGMPGWTTRSLNGAWIETWVVKKLFAKFFENGESAFRVMECDVATYFKNNPAIEPSIF